MVLLVVICACFVLARSQLSIDVAPHGTYSIEVGKKTWLRGGGPEILLPRRGLVLTQSSNATMSSGSDQWGEFTETTLHWSDTERMVQLDTAFRTYEDGVTAVLEQRWVNGLPKNGDGVGDSCPTAVLNNTDQTGGQLEKKVENTTEATCCDACAGLHGCNAWVRDPFTSECFLVSGATGTKSASDRQVGFIGGVPASQSSPIAAFPSLSTQGGEVVLRGISFGGCQLSGSQSFAWGNELPGDSNTDHLPLLVFDSSMQSLAIGPFTNPLTAVVGTGSDVNGSVMVEMGLKQTVPSLPANTSHAIVFRLGTGAKSTLMAWADLRLAQTKKSRVDAYNVTMLAKLTAWEDHGAWLYHNPGPWPNMQEAILAAIQAFEEQQLPFRVVQFDDWWPQLDGSDFSSGTYWWYPSKSTIPAGISAWQPLQVSAYNPGYSSSSIYIQDSSRYPWKWAVDGDHAIPLEKGFYDALFANASKMNTVDFEQDFLCSYQVSTNLTNSDLEQGLVWLRDSIGAAALDAGISVQLCMSNPAHAIASMEIPAVSNMRATRDNTHSDATNGLVLGTSSMLIYAVGLWPSRDNVWTSSPQPGCSEGDCVEPNIIAENTLAVYSGPYGPSDKPGMSNASVIWRSVRRDGILLRPDHPIIVTDAGLRTEFKDGNPRYLWGSVSKPKGTSFAYLVSINVPDAISVTPYDLLEDPTHSQSPTPFIVYAVWDDGNNGTTPTSFSACSSSSPFTVPASPPPSSKALLNFHHYVASQVASSGWAFLGESDKFVPGSTRRISSVSSTPSTFTANVILAANETATFAILPPSATSTILHSTSSRTTSVPLTTNCVSTAPLPKTLYDYTDDDFPMTISCTPTSCQCS